VGYQYNNLGMLTGFGTSSSYYLDATDYYATGQDEGTTVAPTATSWSRNTPTTRPPAG
jgi:hypothetical protein